MKLSSKEAISLMLDGEVLERNNVLNLKARYVYSEGFLITDGKDTYPVDNAYWLTDGWQVQKKYNPIPKEWTNDWANYRAVDANGELYEYIHRPCKDHAMWVTTANIPPCGENTYFISEGHDPTNWENSLQPRLTTSTEPTTTGEQSILNRIERIEKALGL